MMNRYCNEEMAWSELQDLQRELENHRLIDRGGQALGSRLLRLARRIWLIAGLAARRAPRWRSSAGAPEPSRPIAS